MSASAVQGVELEVTEGITEHSSRVALKGAQSERELEV